MEDWSKATEIGKGLGGSTKPLQNLVEGYDTATKVLVDIDGSMGCVLWEDVMPSGDAMM